MKKLIYNHSAHLNDDDVIGVLTEMGPTYEWWVNVLIENDSNTKNQVTCWAVDYVSIISPIG
jgi:hypothetical protein